MNVVTGAFGYIGKYITRHLLEQGGQVRTITTHPDKPNPFGSVVQALPYNFDKPDQLIASLRGASVLYNTYWIRFNYGSATFEQALQNTATLFKCAREAGVQKIVHISVTQASVESDLPYYRGKALQEQALIDCGVPYSIVRPTLVYGKEDILVNNIAWLIRKFPVFPIFGSGHYKVQPVFVEDLARISVAAVGAPGNITLDAIGPETFSFEALVKLIAAKIKPGVTLAHIPPSMGILLGQIIGSALGDILLTRDELQGLMNGLLTSEQAPNGTTRFSDWLESNGSELGSTYSSEIHRHFKWKSAA
jgi:uncharacterized protein YbjT (DUF2867 family)